MSEKELIPYVQKMNRKLNNLEVLITAGTNQNIEKALQERVEEVKDELEIAFNRIFLSQAESLAFSELKRKIEFLLDKISTKKVQIDEEYDTAMEEKLENFRRKATISNDFNEKYEIGLHIENLIQEERKNIQENASEEDLNRYQNFETLANDVLKDIENQLKDMDEYQEAKIIASKGRTEKYKNLSKEAEKLRKKVEAGNCSLVDLKKNKLQLEKVSDSLSETIYNARGKHINLAKEEEIALHEAYGMVNDTLAVVSKKYHEELETTDALFVTFGCLGMRDIKRLYEEAIRATSAQDVEKTIQEFNKQMKKIEQLVTQGIVKPAEVGEQRIQFLKKEIAAMNDYSHTLPEVENKNRRGIKNFFANKGWFIKKEKKEKEASSKKALKLSKGTLIGGIAVLGAVTVIGGLAMQNYQLKKEKEEFFKNIEPNSEKTMDTAHQYLKFEEEKEEVLAANEMSFSQEKVEVEPISKEEKIMELVLELKDRLNYYDAMNVTTEQALALFIHLNAANSFTENNELALDKITRENLIKKYYVGLTEGTEEFSSYTITDADLSRLATAVYELRSAALNRVAVLNDQGKYAESKEIIGIFKEFITEESLKDEVTVLTSSIANMQTNDSTTKKRELYRYYNFIFAGPKSDVRNFDAYGYYVDGDNKEMTYENQGTTVRFYTWLIDCFSGLHVKNIIPQDIINSKNVKLMDQSNLMQILGYTQCSESAFGTYYSVQFMDTPIENRNTRSSKSTGQSSSSKSNVAQALGNEQLDAEMHTQLQIHDNVGDTFKTSDGATNTVIDKGDRSVTVAVVPDPSSEEIKDTTPSGENQSETVEGGGNEKEEDIKFKKDKDTVVLDPGGEVIYEEESDVVSSSTVVVEEEITFEEDETEEVIVIEVTDDVEIQQTNEAQTEVNTSLSYANYSELQKLQALREFFIQTTDQNTIDTKEDFTYVKTYQI